MSDSPQNPFGQDPAPPGSPTPQPGGGALTAVLVLGGAGVAIAVAIFLAFSLFRNQAQDFSFLKPSDDTQKQVEPVETPEPPPQEEPTVDPDSDPWTRVEPGSASASSGNLKAEVSQLAALRFPGQPPVFFKAVLENKGDGPIGFAKVEVELLSAGGKSLETKSGYSAMHTLFPGEKSPITVVFSKPPAYAKARARVLPLKKPYVDKKNHAIDVKLRRLTRVSVYGYRVAGWATNRESVPVTNVKIATMLFARDGKLIGAGTGFLGKKVVAPGERRAFSFQVTPVNGNAVNAEFVTEAREAK